MAYSIAQVAEKTGLSVYTLRYYDKEGLLPFIQRTERGNRSFTDEDLEWIGLINCLERYGDVGETNPRFLPPSAYREMKRWRSAGRSLLSKESGF